MGVIVGNEGGRVCFFQYLDLAGKVFIVHGLAVLGISVGNPHSDGALCPIGHGPDMFNQFDSIITDNERADVLWFKPAAGGPDTFTIPGVAVVECRERGVIHIPQLVAMEKTVFAILGKEPIEPDKMLYIPGRPAKIPVDHFPIRPIGQHLLRIFIIEQWVAVDVRQSHIVHIYVFWRLGKWVSNRFHGVHLIQCRFVLLSYPVERRPGM